MLSETKNYWNSSKIAKQQGQYSVGFLLEDENEDLAYYRFRKEISCITELLKNKKGGNFLDLGCGAGNCLFYYRNDFRTLIGIDFSKSMIK